MDLIAYVLGSVLAFFVGIIGNIFAHDICASADNICAKIIRAAAARLATFDRHSTEEEWLADLQEYQTVTEKYRHAVGCFLAAPEMRRFALKTPPFIAEAPGLVWRKRKDKVWEARWQAPQMVIARGFHIKSVKLGVWKASTVTEDDRDFLIEVTNELQSDADTWLKRRS